MLENLKKNFITRLLLSMIILWVILAVIFVVVSAIGRGQMLEDLVKQTKQKVREGSHISKKEIWDEWRIWVCVVFFTGLGISLFYLFVPAYKQNKLWLGFFVGVFLGLFTGFIWQIKAVKVGKALRKPDKTHYLLGILCFIGATTTLLSWI